MAISQNLDSFERLDLVKFLILKKASLEVADAAGSTPLIEAAKTGFVPFLQYLVRAPLFQLSIGATSETSDLMGKTPLMWASERGHYDAVDILLSKGADPGVKDKSDRCASDFARGPRQEEIVRLLNYEPPPIPNSDSFERVLAVLAEYKKLQAGLATKLDLAAIERRNNVVDEIIGSESHSLWLGLKHQLPEIQARASASVLKAPAKEALWGEYLRKLESFEIAFKELRALKELHAFWRGQPAFSMDRWQELDEEVSRVLLQIKRTEEDIDLGKHSLIKGSRRRSQNHADQNRLSEELEKLKLRLTELRTEMQKMRTMINNKTLFPEFQSPELWREVYGLNDLKFRDFEELDPLVGADEVVGADLNGKHCCIKKFRLRGQSEVAQFLKTTELLRRLDHPHIWRGNSFYELRNPNPMTLWNSNPNPTPFLNFPVQAAFQDEQFGYFQLPSYQSWVEYRNVNQTDLASRQQLACRDILKAVDFLHRQHILHRDLRLGNVFMANDGSAVLGDFSKAFDTLEPSCSALTLVRPY